MMRNKRRLAIAALVLVLALFVGVNGAWAQCCYPCYVGSTVLSDTCYSMTQYCPPFWLYCVAEIQYFDLCGNIWVTQYTGCDYSA
jgi:hypothetical protein